MHLNKSQLAEAFNVSRTTIDAWARRGCPFVERGDHGKEYAFSLPAVIQWRVNMLGGSDPFLETPEVEIFQFLFAETLKELGLSPVQTDEFYFLLEELSSVAYQGFKKKDLKKIRKELDVIRKHLGRIAKITYEEVDLSKIKIEP